MEDHTGVLGTMVRSLLEYLVKVDDIHSASGHISFLPITSSADRLERMCWEKRVGTHNMQRVITTCFQSLTDGPYLALKLRAGFLPVIADLSPLPQKVSRKHRTGPW